MRGEAVLEGPDTHHAEDRRARELCGPDQPSQGRARHAAAQPGRQHRRQQPRGEGRVLEKREAGPGPCGHGADFGGRPVLEQTAFVRGRPRQEPPEGTPEGGALVRRLSCGDERAPGRLEEEVPQEEFLRVLAGDPSDARDLGEHLRHGPERRPSGDGGDVGRLRVRLCVPVHHRVCGEAGAVRVEGLLLWPAGLLELVRRHVLGRLSCGYSVQDPRQDHARGRRAARARPVPADQDLQALQARAARAHLALRVLPRAEAHDHGRVLRLAGADVGHRPPGRARLPGGRGHDEPRGRGAGRVQLRHRLHVHALPVLDGGLRGLRRDPSVGAAPRGVRRSLDDLLRPDDHVRHRRALQLDHGHLHRQLCHDPDDA
mmetsp:Transcript_126436/g.393518  ORF Transcript_126436/g.393518 Transcript_126436/m.393518 type:complete len:373 (+) Transcript_126436:362-1480(+)